MCGPGGHSWPSRNRRACCRSKRCRYECGCGCGRQSGRDSRGGRGGGGLEAAEQARVQQPAGGRACIEARRAQHLTTHQSSSTVSASPSFLIIRSAPTPTSHHHVSHSNKFTSLQVGLLISHTIVVLNCDDSETSYFWESNKTNWRLSSVLWLPRKDLA